MGHTRIPSPTICTSIITRHRLDELLECSLVPRLMALAQGRCHVVSMYVRV